MQSINRIELKNESIPFPLLKQSSSWSCLGSSYLKRCMFFILEFMRFCLSGNLFSKVIWVQEAQEIHKKLKASENLQFENPMLVDLCGILFPKNSKSIWNGPHSLVQQRTSHTSSIHAVINMLMK